MRFPSLMSVVLSLVFAANQGFAAEIKLGVAAPFTGSNAPFGEQIWRGAEMAAKDINAAGGINGDKIILVKGDDACEPKQAVAVANRLVDRDKVQAVVGHLCSSSNMPASDVYSEADVLAITPGSTNPALTERKLTNVLRSCGRDDQQGVVAADFLAKKLKVKRVAIIHDKDTYGQGLANATRSQLASYGIKEVLYEGLTRGEKDFNALVTKIKAANVDAVYFGGFYAEAGLLVRQMREQGLKAAFISGDAIVSNEFVSSASGNKFVDGVYMTFGADPRKIKEGQDVVARFRKEKYEPEGYTLYSYVTVQAIAAAIKGAAKPTGTERAKWLKANTVKTIMGPKSWDAKGDLKVTDYVIYQWGKDGKYSELAK